MSLSDMVAFITGKVGQYDDTSKVLCRQYINARYKMVWDDFFWRDTYMVATATVVAYGSEFYYPAGVDRIVSIRAGTDTFLDPVDEAFLFETDPTIFDRQGPPLYYSERRSPTGGDSAPTAPTSTRVAVATDNFNRPDGYLGSNWGTPPATDGIAGGNAMYIRSTQATPFATNSRTHAYWSGTGAFTNDQYSQVVLGNVGGWSGPLCRASAAVDAFYIGMIFGANDYRIYLRSAGVDTSLATASAATWNSGDVARLEVVGAYPYTVITLYQNDVQVLQYVDTTNNVTGGAPGIGSYSPSTMSPAYLVMDGWEGGNMVTPVLSVPPDGPITDDSSTPSKVKIYPSPDADTKFFIFAKRSCPQLTNDDGVSILRNCDNAIIAFAMSDMLERLRQYGKAQAKFAEAKQLLDEAKAVEQQQANRPRRNKNLTVVGNSLLEMTDAVCGICNAWTPDMRILVKEFLRRNYVALYDLTLWPESTIMVRVPIDNEQMVMPHFMDRVMSVRGGDGFTLMPADVSWMFGVNPGVFEQTGTPVTFSILTPVGVANLPPNPPEALAIATTDALDTGKHIFIRGESSGSEVTEDFVLPFPGIPTLTQYAYDVPITIAKDITEGDITVSSSSNGILLEQIPADERERKHQRIWLLPPPTTTTSTLPPTNGPTPPPTTPPPSCLVLGKRKIIPLRADQDTPIITGAQNVLIAGAAADLFTRMGNAPSSALYQQRAATAAQALVKVNTDQAAFAPKLVPIIEPHPFGVDIDTIWSKQ